MIRSFRHKGLKLLFDNDDRRKVQPAQADKIGRILLALNSAVQAEDMALPGFRLHALRGDLAGFWAVSVSGNWRLVWRFDGADAVDVDLVDYH